MIIPVTQLPSGFKPYPFKSFKMKAITMQNAIDLGRNPSLKEITALIQNLAGDEIDASLLVPIDVKYILAMLSYHAYPKQTWTLKLICPYCKYEHTKNVTMKDFPPVPSLSEEDPYPLTIDDGTHVWELGYASSEAVDKFLGKNNITTATNAEELMQDMSKAIDMVEPYILSVDHSTKGIREKLLGMEDLGLLGYMVEVIQKFFTEDTYSEMTCPKCKKKYRVPMSALEVAQYTPFRNAATTGKYKTNFRL